MTVRLTPAEWRAVIGAFADADSMREDDRDDQTAYGAEIRRQDAARERALSKIHDALTTPSIRRQAFP